MAIIYSYPHAVPSINDMVLGAIFRENEGTTTNSFYISDLATIISAEIATTPGPAGPQGPQGTTGATGVQGVQGAQGIQGLAGEVGPAGLEWRGAWSSGTSYAADDAVAYDGASWFCILATSGTTPPDTDTTHWALLAAQGAPGVQGIQGIPGIQGVAGAQGPQGIQGIQGLPGAAATQTLQQTVALGNTISGDVGGVTFTTTLTNTSVKVGASTTSGMTLNPNQIICEKSGGSNFMVLQFPAVISGVRQITLPNATGTVALISDVTLQKAITGGNTITDGYNTMTVTAESIKTNNFLGGQIEVVGGISTAKPYIKFGLPSSGGNTATLTHADTQVGNVTVKLPNYSGTLALTTDITLQQAFTNGNTIVSGNFKTGVFDLTTGVSVENTSTLSKTTLETTKITLTKNASGLKTTNILQAVTPTSNRTIYFPDADGTIALTTDIITPTLQQVTTAGNGITNNIFINGGNILEVAQTGNTSQVYSNIITTSNSTNGTNAFIHSDGYIGLGNASGFSTNIRATDLTSNGVIFQLPNKTAGSYTIATTSDIITPTLQQVTTAGATTTNEIVTTNNIVVNGNKDISVNFGNNLSAVYSSSIGTYNNSTGAYTLIHSNGYIGLGNPTNYQTQIAANNLANNGVGFELPNKTTGTYTLATIDNIPNLGPLTQGTISSVSPTTPYDVMPYRINISVAPTSSHISLPTSNLTVGQEVYIQTINAAIIHGNPSNTSATTIFTSSGTSVSNFTTSAGAFYKFTYLGVLDTYAPNARWVYQVLNQ